MSALCKKINKFTRKKWGNQVSRSLSVVIPASCVWIVTGVWHGAASCFVLWGIYHGILIVSSGLFEIPIQKLCKFLHMEMCIRDSNKAVEEKYRFFSFGDAMFIKE